MTFSTFSQQLHAGRSAVLKDAELLPLVPAARRCNQRRHRHRQLERPGATAAASRWAVAAGPSRQPPALSLPRPPIIACALAIRVLSELDLRIQVGLGTQLVRPDT